MCSQRVQISLILSLFTCKTVCMRHIGSVFKNIMFCDFRFITLGSLSYYFWKTFSDNFAVLRSECLSIVFIAEINFFHKFQKGLIIAVLVFRTMWPLHELQKRIRKLHVRFSTYRISLHTFFSVSYCLLIYQNIFIKSNLSWKINDI